MNLRSAIATMASALLLLVLLLYLGFTALANLPSEVRTAIIAVVVSLATALFGKRLERQHTIDEERRKEKWPIYESFVHYWLDYLMADKTGKDKPDQKNVAIFLVKFGAKLTLVGSADVIRAYNDFRLYATNDAATQGLGLMIKFEALLKAMRTEFGHDANALKEGEILELFINDIRQKLAEHRSTRS